MAPRVIPALKAMPAVDAAGVHPHMLAIGSERYTPYAKEKRPQEILTIANAILGFGQASLAKYLWIVAGEDDPALKVHDIPAFFTHVLQRVDWRSDIHFQTCTTIDSLDYSGSGLNRGSKAIIAVAGAARRELAREISGLHLPDLFSDTRVALPGILSIQGPRWQSYAQAAEDMKQLSDCLKARQNLMDVFPLVVLADDSAFLAQHISNFLWVTFTRSNPSHDVYGVGSFSEHKHWGCAGPLIIDARIKSHHAPPLETDPEIKKRVDKLAAKGGPLYGVI
jgi:4-hydroxy-3-polyprenylbenzoate decarboxylase